MRRKAVAWTLFLGSLLLLSLAATPYSRAADAALISVCLDGVFDSRGARTLEKPARTAWESRSRQFRCGRPFSATLSPQIGRASCRERVERGVLGVVVKEQ